MYAHGVSFDGWHVLCIIVGPLPFSKSCLDTSVVVKWHHINEIEFNYLKHLDKVCIHPTYVHLLEAQCKVFHSVNCACIMDVTKTHIKALNSCMTAVR